MEPLFVSVFSFHEAQIKLLFVERLFLNLLFHFNFLQNPSSIPKTLEEFRLEDFLVYFMHFTLSRQPTTYIHKIFSKYIDGGKKYCKFKLKSLYYLCFVACIVYFYIHHHLMFAVQVAKTILHIGRFGLSNYC